MNELVPTATEARIVGAMSRAGGAAAGLGASLTILWLITMAFSPVASGGTTLDHVLALRADDARRSLLFAVTLPLGLTFVPVWLALASAAWRSHPVASSLTVAYGLMYAPLSTTAYWLQLTTARGVADAYDRDPAGTVAVYGLFDFGTAGSLTTALDLLGYSVLGLGTLAAAVLLWSDGRLGRVAGSMFAASGLLSIVGAIGMSLRWPWLEWAVIGAGVPFLVAILVTAWLLWRRGASQPGATRLASA